jgi:hypothetical protein
MADEKATPVFTFLKDDGTPMEFEDKKDGIEDVEGTEGGEEIEDADDQVDDNEGEGEGEDDNSDNGDSSDSDSEDSSDDGDEVDSGSSDLDEEEEDEEDDVEDLEDEEEEDEEDDVEDDDIVDYKELPENVQKYLDFLEETGGSFEDFVKINQDFSKLPQDQVIRDYIRQNNPYFDEADVEFEMEKLFGIDEEADSEYEIRAKKVAKKRYYGEAIKYFENQKGKWKADLVSRSSELPKEVQEAVAFKQQYEQQQQAVIKKTEESRRSFVKQTNKLLGKDFKGFEVKLGDETVTYKPENVRKVKEQNLNVNNLLNRFLDKDGNVSDVAGYHRALAVASDPEAFAQHFFELGKAAMAEEDAKDSKNIQMKPRQQKAKPKGKSTKFKLVDDESSSNKGKIRFRNY